MPAIEVPNNVITHLALVEYFAKSQSGKICLLYGDERVFSLSLLLASHTLAKNKTLAVIDGCNRFGVHTISTFARQRRIRPEVLLKKIYISRGFTSYQMEAALTERLVPFLKRIGSDTALVFGLLDTFYDEQVPFREVKEMLRRILLYLDRMRRQGISILLVSKDWNIRPGERNQLFDTMKQAADTIYRLAEISTELDKQIKTKRRNLDANDEIKFLVEKERSKNYGQNTPNIYENNRRRD